MSQETFRKLRQMLMEKLDVCQELTDQEILETIDELILDSLRESGVSLKEKVQLRQELFYSVRKLDVLQELIEDETVTEIMVNGPDSIFVERKGRLTKWPKSFTDQEKLEDVIQQIVGKCNRIVNESSPIVDARLETGARVNVVIYPVALNGPILTIRRFPDKPITMEKLIELGSVTPECAEFLEKLVKARYSIVIGGGTGSGKTTFLGALSEYIPRDERIITIEDNAELKIQGIANLVRLEARAATVNGAPAVSIRDLIRSALRMRPDRIIVGEVRGGEAMDMLQALNTGHEGSLGTAHANSSRDMLARLEIMTLMAELDLPLQAVRRQIASGVDILIHLGRMRDRSRKLLEISEVCGYEDGEIKDPALISVAGRKRSCKDGAFDAPGKTGTCGGETMNGKNTDYEKYQYSVKEIIRYVSECVILCLVVDYLFYKNIWMLLLAVPLPVLYLKWKKKQLIRERKRRLNYQFRDALNSMSVAVQAGYSVENAVSACVRDLEQLYEKNADIAREFRYIENQQKVSVPVEDLFLDLGKRCRVEDIENFASILYTAKRSGGDLGNVIQKVARMLGDKIDVKKEIESTLAAKKSEQMIMSLMPAGIILYLQLASPGFLDMLYGNPFGIGAMSVCLAVYGTAYWMGKRIVEIEV